MNVVKGVPFREDLNSGEVFNALGKADFPFDMKVYNPSFEALALAPYDGWSFSISPTMKGDKRTNTISIDGEAFRFIDLDSSYVSKLKGTIVYDDNDVPILAIDAAKRFIVSCVDMTHLHAEDIEDYITAMVKIFRKVADGSLEANEDERKKRVQFKNIEKYLNRPSPEIKQLRQGITNAEANINAQRKQIMAYTEEIAKNMSKLEVLEQFDNKREVGKWKRLLLDKRIKLVEVNGEELTIHTNKIVMGGRTIGEFTIQPEPKSLTITNKTPKGAIHHPRQKEFQNIVVDNHVMVRDALMGKLTRFIRKVLDMMEDGRDMSDEVEDNLSLFEEKKLDGRSKKARAIKAAQVAV